MSIVSQARLRLLAGAALIALPAVAHAAPAPAADAAAAPAEAPADTAADANGGLQDVVVTATKRETNLQKTPIAISVVDPQVMKDRHVQSLLDLADGGVPSLRIATFEARQSALTVGIRGIVPFDANQTARDQGVGVYIDGVYLGRQQGLNAALFDVERIEVLRGPQGTLFGRNTEGGAVSIVTRAPTGEFGGRVSAGVGNYGGYNGELHLNLPAIANISFKIDGLVQHQDALVKNPLPGNYGWGYYNRYGGRITALWKPVDGLSVELSYDRARDENTPFYSQLVNYNPKNLPVATLAQINANNGKLPAGMIAPLSPLVKVSGDKRMDVADIGVPQQLSVDKTDGFAATIRYKASPDIELRSITAWRGVTTDQWDNSGGAHRTVFLPNAKFSRYSLSWLHQRQFSQELQAVGSLPNLDYAAGLYYFTERAQEEAATPSTNQWNADGTGYTVLSPVVTGPIASGNQGWAPDNWFRQRGSWARARSYAAFAQATYTPEGLDMFHLTVGGRYTKDKRYGRLYLVSGAATPWEFRFDKSRFDPMVTLAVDAAQGVNLYAKYSTGYRAGGANDRSSNFGAFGPESVKAYEVGAKMDLLDHRVRLNLAGYIMDRSGTQIDFDHVDTNPFLPGTSTPNPTFNLHTEDTANAPGNSKIRGVEAELTVKPVDGLTMGASYAYTYTHIPPTPNPQDAGKLTQVFVVFTPRNAASGFVDYEMPVGGGDTKIRLHLDANYASSMYSFQNEATKTQPSFVVNGRIALTDIQLNDHGQKFTLAVWSRNLFNETHIYRRSSANAAVLGDYANFNPPRTFGVEGSVNF
ncbi:TonB-dependent receptor [Sphingomonas sp. MMSM20]|uniref:TonB-dependent receptor n=1 Tax=Sphingomonas lycopersici TaxID=2951807 RepID=UPI002237B2B5|nr:TonB-dependent receptor [Sphingomonas lycopersici]MCW6531403.1 TonB-dependent receptor [Sphingomonas lycopersici]